MWGGHSQNFILQKPMQQVFQVLHGQDVAITAEARAELATKGPDLGPTEALVKQTGTLHRQKTLKQLA